MTVTSNPNNYTPDAQVERNERIRGKFTIVAGTGQIKVKSALDYETKTSYEVIVTVKAAAAGANAQSFSLDPNNPGTTTW